MLSELAQGKLDNWLINYCNANNIGMYRNNPVYYGLQTRLGLLDQIPINADSFVEHFIKNYKFYRYALATRTKFTGTINNLAIYSNWKYNDLITGEVINDVVFLDNVNELLKTDTIKIIYIQRKITDIIYNGDNGGNGGDENGKKYTGTSPLKFTQTKTETENIIAGFDTKNILYIALAAAVIYFITK